MVWYRGSEPPVDPTKWDLLGIALGGAPVWTCGAGVHFTKRSVGRRLRVTYKGCYIYIYIMFLGDETTVYSGYN